MNLHDLLSRVAETLGAGIAVVSRLEIAVAILCVLIILYVVTHLWVILQREQRLTALKRSVAPLLLSESKLDLTAVTSPPWYDRLGAAIASSVFVGVADGSRLSRALASAGLHGGKYRLATLIAVKFGTFAVAVFGTWFAVTFYGLFAHAVMVNFIVLLCAALIGWRVPDSVLAWLAKRRKRRIGSALPDAFDLLVISAEAGLSFEQGIEFVAREMAPVMAEISEELAITSAELRVLGDRREALQNFANRINLQAVRSVVTTLTQTMRYGTPLAQSLRLLASEMRTARLMRMEERAARMPVLLTLPLMGFILPSLLMVVAGPAVLKVIDAFGTLAK